MLPVWEDINGLRVEAGEDTYTLQAPAGRPIRGQSGGSAPTLANERPARGLQRVLGVYCKDPTDIRGSEFSSRKYFIVIDFESVQYSI